MALLSTQLLFVERVDDETVVLDVIVLDRPSTPASPPVGSPLAFAFTLPAGDEAAIVTVLEGWARHSMPVALNLLERRGETRVLVSCSSGRVELGPPHGALR